MYVTISQKFCPSSMTTKREGEPLEGRNVVQKTGKPIITFVTGNAKKLEEVKAILCKDENISFELTNKKVDLPELQGEPDEISKEKCKLAFKELKKNFLKKILKIVRQLLFFQQYFIQNSNFLHSKFQNN